MDTATFVNYIGCDKKSMANQYEVDPRQALFLTNYLDPKSKTFANAKQSAISAGYSEEYAKVIMNKDSDWLSENVNLAKMLNKAEKNIEKLLDEQEDKRLLLEVSKLVATRIGKNKWSERQEHTGAGGEDLFPKPLLGGESNYGNTNNNSNQEAPRSEEED